MRLNFSEAFQLVQKSKKYIQSDPKFNELATLVTIKLTILTDPPGADVFIREYSDLNGAWKKIGRTPIQNMALPGFSFLSGEIYKTGIYRCPCNSCYRHWYKKVK